MRQSIKTYSILACFALAITSQLQAQDATVTVHQDQEISKLLTLKKEVNKSGKSLNLLTIQIYSGNRSGALNAQSKFLSKYGGFGAKMSYETPYYKIRVGRFKSRLEADKALKRIKREFSNAFILNPRKD